MIETISDLEDYSDAEIEQARQSINFKGLAYRALKEEGSQPGLTLDEWRKKKDGRKPKPCPTCEGKGTLIERMRTVGTIHASSAEKCVAALYFDVTGEIAPDVYLKPELLITFQIGHAIHAYIQGLLYKVVDEDEGPLFYFEDEVTVDLPEALICGGSADGDSDWPKARCLLEIKTMGPSEFPKLRKPKKEHITQAMGLYAKGLDAPFVSFLYISKMWPHEMKEYVMVYDEAVFQKWYAEKGIKVEEALEKGRPPLAKASAYECKQCGYRNGCSQAVGIRDRFAKV